MDFAARSTDLIAAALACEWRVTHTDDDLKVGILRFVRRNPDDRRKVEYVHVYLTVTGTIRSATWAPTQDGIGARTVHSGVAGKAEWVAKRFARGQSS